MMTDAEILKLYDVRSVFLGYRGSIAHGTYIHPGEEYSSDDIDLIGIHMNPVEHYIGLHTTKDAVVIMKDSFDIVGYEFKKMVNMLINCNPNVFPILWLDKKLTLKNTFYARALTDNKELFVSSKVFHSFTGHARGELKKIGPEKAYKGYMGAKRKELVDRIGYDSKHASHSIRLLRMCCEYLRTGSLQVTRTTDAQELIDIKLGKYLLTEVIDEINGLLSLSKELYARTELPPEPQVDKINEIVMSIIYDYIISTYRR